MRSRRRRHFRPRVMWLPMFDSAAGDRSIRQITEPVFTGISNATGQIMQLADKPVGAGSVLFEASNTVGSIRIKRIVGRIYWSVNPNADRTCTITSEDQLLLECGLRIDQLDSLGNPIVTANVVDRADTAKRFFWREHAMIYPQSGHGTWWSDPCMELFTSGGPTEGTQYNPFKIDIQPNVTMGLEQSLSLHSKLTRPLGAGTVTNPDVYNYVAELSILVEPVKGVGRRI